MAGVAGGGGKDGDDDDDAHDELMCRCLEIPCPSLEPTVL